MKFLIINGPNLNFLGIREPNIYGSLTYQDLCEYLNKTAEEFQVEIEIAQTNYEGKIIDLIQEAYLKKINGIIINAGALTHYSYAILDALKSVDIPSVEVHLSDIYAREEFRKTSVIRKACVANFYGEGFNSYKRALEYLVERGI